MIVTEAGCCAHDSEAHNKAVNDSTCQGAFPFGNPKDITPWSGQDSNPVPSAPDPVALFTRPQRPL